MKYHCFAALIVAASLPPCISWGSGEGFFQISLSTDTQFLNVSAVHPTTLQPLPSTFPSDPSGNYFLAGLIVLDGDTANPIGNFEITGQGDPQIQMESEWFAGDPNQIPGITIFASIVAGISISEPPSGIYETLQTELEIKAARHGDTSPRSTLGSLSTFFETEDGLSANAALAGLSGPFSLPGETHLHSDVVDVPDLPPGTKFDEFSLLVVQNDIALFDIDQDSPVSFTSTARSVVFNPLATLPGDYNGDGIVGAADYPMWRDHVGSPDESVITNNGNGGGVGAGDYAVWRTNFGATSGATLRVANLPAVPEPAIANLLLGIVFTLSGARGALR